MQNLIFYTPFTDFDNSDTVHVMETSVLTLLGLETPKMALYTGLYGATSSRRAFPLIDSKFKEVGQRCCAISVEFDFDVDPLKYTCIESKPNKNDIELDQSNVFNTLRLSSDLKTHVKAQWKALMISSGAPIKPELPQAITQSGLVDSFLDPYPQVELFIYQVMSPVGPLSVASVYNKHPSSMKSWFDIEGTVEFNGDTSPP